jgi:DNA-binding transcriptional LysR family regulator
MILNPLRLFHEVARTGSIRKASEALKLAPSSVSRQVLILERQIGTTLLDRSAAGVALTPAGQLVANYARTVILDYDTLRAELDDLKGAGRAVIRIAAVESVILEAPLATISRFRARFPEVQFRLNMRTAHEVADEVRSGVADLGLTLNYMPDPAFRTILELNEPLVLAVRRDHRLAARTSICLAELATEPLALHEPSHSLRQAVDEATKAHGFLISPVLSTSSLEVLRGFVRSGLGGAILTRGGVERDGSGLMVAVPIDEPSLGAGNIVLLTRADRRLSRILRLFVSELVEALQQARPLP